MYIIVVNFLQILVNLVKMMSTSILNFKVFMCTTQHIIEILKRSVDFFKILSRTFAPKYLHQFRNKYNNLKYLLLVT